MYVFIYFFYQDAKLSEAWKSKMHPFLSKFSSDKSWVTLTRYKNFHALFIFLVLQSQGTNVFILQQSLDILKIYSSRIHLSTTRNPAIFNIIRWVAWSLGRTTHWPSVWCTKYYLFFIISCQILSKNRFNLFSYLRKIKTISFECPKSIRNYEKKQCLEHETLGRWVVRPIDPASQGIKLKIVGF